MPEKNQIYRAVIEGYTSEGLGVARIGGQAVFVHGALRGEECDILILKVLKNAAFGKAVRVYEPSPHRVEPDCPYYGRCGGCDFRHMDRAEELAAKIKGQVVTAKVKGGASGKLYGKVTGKEVAELLTQLTGTEIDKKKVELPSAIKEFGSYDAAVRLYAGVVAPFKLKVEEL